MKCKSCEWHLFEQLHNHPDCNSCIHPTAFIRKAFDPTGTNENCKGYKEDVGDEYRCCLTCNYMHIASDPSFETKGDCAHPNDDIRDDAEKQVYVADIEETKCSGWIAFVENPDLEEIQ